MAPKFRELFISQHNVQKHFTSTTDNSQNYFRKRKYLPFKMNPSGIDLQPAWNK